MPLSRLGRRAATLRWLGQGWDRAAHAPVRVAPAARGLRGGRFRWGLRRRRARRITGAGAAGLVRAGLRLPRHGELRSRQLAACSTELDRLECRQQRCAGASATLPEPWPHRPRRRCVRRAPVGPRPPRSWRGRCSAASPPPSGDRLPRRGLARAGLLVVAGSGLPPAFFARLLGAGLLRAGSWLRAGRCARSLVQPLQDTGERRGSLTGGPADHVGDLPDSGHDRRRCVRSP